jgi:cytoskeleton protein RodZ
MMTQTIGEYLKEKRLEKHIQLEQIAQTTHIRLKYLEALEKDRLNAFPSRVHGRGFLRMYADYLGVPAQPLLDAWDSGIIQQEPDHPSQPEEIKEEQVESIQQEISLTIGKDEYAPPGIEAEEQTPGIEEVPSSSEASEIFKEIGQTIREQRESLGLTLNDVERFTHVRIHHLQAIEEGNLKALPSPVQGRGMIDSYASFLDLDTQSILLRFAEGLQIRRQERVESQAPRPVKKAIEKPRKAAPAPSGKPWKRLLSPDLLVGGGIIIVLVVFGIWTTSRVIAQRNKESEATIPAISAVLAATPSITATYDETPVQTGTPGIPEVTGSEEVISTNSSFQGTEPAVTMPAVNDAPLQVYIVAQQRAYLKVTVDQKVEFDGRVSPGNAYPFAGNESIELLTGNSAALQVFFNQEDLGILGTFGQVSDVIFTQQGMITPTPLATRTPTTTQPATSTLESSLTAASPTVTPYVP